MNFLPLIVIGFLPGLIWLAFFLHKDHDHPEPRSMVIQSFALGMMITIPAAIIEMVINKQVETLELGAISHTIISFFVTVAFVEEYLKYLIMKKWVMRTRFFDEPIDAMIYPVVIALGFASLENILAGFNMPEEFVSLMVWRFISATLIHALSASVWGYFIASVYFFKKPHYFLYIGLVCGVLIHGLYNFIVSFNSPEIFNLFFPLLILPVSFLVAIGFKKLHYNELEMRF